MIRFCELKQGSHHHEKPGKWTKMKSMHGNIMELDILKKNMEKIMKFKKNQKIWIMENHGILKRLEEI